MSERYPTDEVLEYIRDYDWTRYGMDDLLQCINAEWWPNGIRPQDRYEDREGRSILILTTGGWSGNEDIIEALRTNKHMWWTVHWLLSKRGGYYEFDITPLK